MMTEILSEDGIEMAVRSLPTTQRRINARKRLRQATNKAIGGEIETRLKEIRALKANGAKDGQLREKWADISKLEYQYLYSIAGIKY